MKRTGRARYYLAAAISFLTFAVYLMSLNNEFVEWDDGVYVFENPSIRSLNGAFLKWAFLDFHAGNWHPLTWISHALDYAVWGLNPLGHHLTNAFFHAVNTYVAVFLIIRLLELAREKTRADDVLQDERVILVTAGVTGILFGLHPLHVESVAWVAERKDVLCAFFFMLSILQYMRYVYASDDSIIQNKTILPFSNKHYFLSLVFFIFASFSKPMAVSLPAVLLILDWYPFRKIRSLKTCVTAVVEKLPFLILSLISSVLTVLAQRSGGALVPIEFAPLSTRLLVAAKALIAYLVKMMAPFNLIPFYPYPLDVSLLSFEYLSAIALVIGITVTCVFIARKQKLWLSVWGYYVVTLMPVLGIVQVGNQFIADRYSYLPSLGPFFLIGLTAALSWRKLHIVKRREMSSMVISVAAVVLLIVPLSYLTIKQIGIWKNSISLWSSVIQQEPTRAPVAYYNRGLAYGKNGQFDKAMEDFDMAIALDPSDSRSYNNRGVIYGLTGSYDKAIDDFSAAILIDETYAVAYYNRGIFYSRTGRKELAMADYRKACELGNEDGCGQLTLRKQ